MRCLKMNLSLTQQEENRGHVTREIREMCPVHIAGGHLLAFAGFIKLAAAFQGERLRK